MCVCNSVISSSFKSCHRPDTIVRRAFHRQISDVPVIQSNYTERNRYCYTPGIDSRQNRKVKIRPHTHLQPGATCLELHAHTQTHTYKHTHTRARAHRFEITWTSNFNILEITNPYRVARPHFCLQRGNV